MEANFTVMDTVTLSLYVQRFDHRSLPLVYPVSGINPDISPFDDSTVSCDDIS
jgi:hypothetical protein